MGGSPWSIVRESSCSRVRCGVADNDASGPTTVACGIAGSDPIGPGAVGGDIAGNDASCPETVACGIAGDDASGPDMIDAGAGAGTDTWTVQANRQPRAVTTTMQAAINVRRRVPLIVSVSPEPRTVRRAASVPESVHVTLV